MTKLVTGLTLAVLFAIAAPLLYLRLFQVNIPRMTRRFHFPENLLYSTRFPIILRAFLSGNNRVIRPFLRLQKVRASLESEDPFYKGFAYEGTGMGFGAKASLWPGRGRRFERYIRELDPLYLYQYYVGLGWWLHIRYRYRFGGYRKWMETLDPRYAHIVFDGVGFRAALFESQEDPSVHLQFEKFPLDCRRVCLQGYGRGLWFVSQFNLEAAVAAIEQLPASYRQDTYSGLGLAVAYSLFDRIPFGIESQARVPSGYRASYCQGMAFGWEARKLQSEGFWYEQLESFTDEYAKCAERYVDWVREAEVLMKHRAEDFGSYYTRWMDQMRMLLKQRGTPQDGSEKEACC
ncbi:hypothetical protein DNH61_12285 [Paenibacillus sambharensis]|uniref:DUF1702 domain-containing protein n=2 Tax=Paenibacillus sambharensis TaxID=1803190 RepID=A0A2W1LAG9_9BACL|nr:hypothetical protein DNH61_12285 [Paenibacillus sambharensis]